MAYLLGVVLAAAVCAFALLACFDRDRAFYPAVLIVVVTYYVLFAVMGSSVPALTIESLVAVAFLMVAVAGPHLCCRVGGGGGPSKREPDSDGSATCGARSHARNAQSIQLDLSFEFP